MHFTSKAEALQKCSEAMIKLAKIFVAGECSEEELYQRRDERVKAEKVAPTK